ncbi:AAA family ATPase [Dyadobacter sp. CY351]|uniref:AAA family ATPase n=1 Tax=Dyadobacter sp. CY351 TaxID=2909337 RepID=UPI001F24C315|nr:AAA family ATPase [Dyadobacter sp. CY351]MCF2521107.1 AAA family ATPase [Dyadobacter sp. CY351]
MQTHLKGFGLQNFRVFKNYTWFDFAPITILTGPNSSGKSSLNKALLLMKDNLNKESELLEKYITYPITHKFWFDYNGGDHNLSSANNSISQDSDDPYISYCIPLRNVFDRNHLLVKFHQIVKEKFVAKYKENDEIARLLAMSNFLEILHLNGQVILGVNTNHSSSIYCDLPLLLDICKNIKIELKSIVADNIHYYDYSFSDITKILDDFTNTFCNIRWTTKNVNFNDLYNNSGPFIQEDIVYDNLTEEVIHYDKNIDQSMFVSLVDGDFHKKIGFLLCQNDERFQYYKDIDSQFSNITSSAIESFCNFLKIVFGSNDSKSIVNLHLPNFRSIHYLPSIKGANERSYRSKDNHILNSLFRQYLERYQVSEIVEEDDLQRKFYYKWFGKFGISLAMNRNDQLDANSYLVNGMSHVDVGYGITQIIAIIIRILSIAESGYLHFFNPGHVLILEEPEANLHPKYQSLLADMFFEAAETFNIQFVIETHSEYLIRKVQYLTAKRQINTEDTVIYYFHDPNGIPKDEKQVKKIQILEDGSLSDDFGPGFFDEAANWELELIRLKNSKYRNN